YPLLLLLPLLAFVWGGGERRRALALGGAGTVAALAVAAPFLLTAPEPFIRAVGLYGERPLHFESQLGALVLALQGPAVLVRSYGSSNVMTPVWLGRLADLALLLGMLAVAAAALRAGGVFALSMLLTGNALLMVLAALAVWAAVVAGRPSSHQ